MGSVLRGRERVAGGELPDKKDPPPEPPPKSSRWYCGASGECHDSVNDSNWFLVFASGYGITLGGAKDAAWFHAERFCALFGDDGKQKRYLKNSSVVYSCAQL
jgi:hypothetical protein